MGAPQKQCSGDIIMKRRSVISFALLLAGLAALSYAPPASSETGWVTLFDGKSLDHFSAIGDANWRLEDGSVVADKGNGFLVSKDAYTDYQIRAEFWVDASANSGIFIRCTDPEKVGANNAYEVNIWDTRPESDYGTGAIVNVSKVDPISRSVSCCPRSIIRKVRLDRRRMSSCDADGRIAPPPIIFASPA